MRVSFARTCVVLLLSISLARTEVTVENGGYNILVAFSQNVFSQNAAEIIEDMKISLQGASEILYNAIGLQFSKVTVVIPESWNTSEWNVVVEDSFDSDSSKADILIDSTNDTVFGKFPFAQQYGSCGVPGHQIIVPTAFFDELNGFPKGISLAREWLKYRYGVFDENGYLDDPLYPLYYHIPGSNVNEVHITDCINSEITYNFTDKEGNDCPSDKMLIDKLKSSECGFHMNEEGLESVTSSFMYFQETLSNMTQICGKDSNHEHNSRSPNKQNTLCYGKSIWDVVSKSSDFKKENKKKDTEFVFLRKAQPRVVVAWENTKKMKKQSKTFLNAVTKLMIDLPDGSKFSAFPFRRNAPIEDYPLKELDGVSTRQTILSSDFVHEEGDYKAAFRKAFTILKDAAENTANPPGNIIIIAGTEADLIVILLKDLSVCTKISSFIEKSAPDDINELVSDLPCLEVVKIPMTEGTENTYEKLIQTMEKIVPSKVDDKLTETLKVECLHENTAINFTIDDLTEKVTVWIFGIKESENFKFEFKGQNETANEKEVYGNVLELSYLPREAGFMRFLYPYETESLLIEVKTTSKVGKYFSGYVTVVDTTDEHDDFQMPVIIYAIVRFGSYPVQNAKVSAIVTRPDGEKIELELNDDGRGDPDITQNDGVYSRYFTDFSGEGEYSVTVSVSNNGFVTRYGADADAGYKSCCGSVVSTDGKPMNEDTPKLNEFTKVFENTFTAKSGRPEDGYKPSRITDLKIDKVTEDGILLKWTAPGGEADSGTVQSYEIKSFTTPEEAKHKFDSGAEILNYTSTPKERGETEELNISYGVFKKNGVHFIAMQAKNSQKASDTSTVIEVNIHNAVTDPPGKEGDETGDENPKTSKTSPKTIGLIVGLIVGLLLLVILIYVVIYVVIVKPKRKKEKENPIYESSKRNESNAMNPISFVSADTLIRHHNEKVKAKTEHKEPPIFKEADFEDRNSQSISEPDSSNDNQGQERSNKSPRNGQQFPPKSPKRITRV